MQPWLEVDLVRRVRLGNQFGSKRGLAKLQPRTMVVFSDLQPSPATEILDRAFRIKNNFFDAGHGCILPQRYRDISEQVRKLNIRSDDVFLCSFPRTGSTWLQEILWLLGNDLDFDKARSVIQQVRNPTLELSCLYDKDHLSFLE